MFCIFLSVFRRSFFARFFRKLQMNILRLEFNNSNEWKTFPVFFSGPRHKTEGERIKKTAAALPTELLNNMKNVCMWKKWKFMMANLFNVKTNFRRIIFLLYIDSTKARG